jgi:hypothetical protein|tara:strand:+ start:381 stop:548 length:168 start_codon:yes stop_codon:yes gene_type:complete
MKVGRFRPVEKAATSSWSLLGDSAENGERSGKVHDRAGSDDGIISGKLKQPEPKG